MNQASLDKIARLPSLGLEPPIVKKVIRKLPNLFISIDKMTSCQTGVNRGGKGHAFICLGFR